MATSRLATTRWVPPGAYLGRKAVPRPANPVLNPRKVAYIGKGSRLKILRNVEVKRSYIYNESLNFFGPPYKAYTTYYAKLDKAMAMLTKANGEAVPFSKWDFGVDTSVTPNKTYVQIDESYFDPDEVYKFSYQSTERTPQDPIPWYPANEMRQFVSAGSTPGNNDFLEFKDFNVVIDTMPSGAASQRVDALIESVPAAPVLDYYQTRASLTVPGAVAGTNTGDVIYTAKLSVDGEDGNVISVEHLNPGTNNSALSATYNATTKKITVSLATDSTGAIAASNTAATIAAAVNAIASPAAPVIATANGTGAGKVGTLPTTYLSGGDTSGDNYTAKDSRTITFKVVGVSTDTATITVDGVSKTVPSFITLGYKSSTQEGGFGTLIINATQPGSGLNASNILTYDKWWIQNPTDTKGTLVKDGLIFRFKNPELFSASPLRNFEWQVDLVNKHKLDWSLLSDGHDKFDSTQVLTDKIGAVTGTAGSKYIILSNTPSAASTVVVKNKLGNVVASTVCLDDHSNATVNVILNSYNAASDGTLEVTYKWRGNEPNPGETYYITCYVLRPAADYNTVITMYSGDEVAEQLAPMTTTNDLYIMAEAAMELRPFSVSIVQIADADSDGVYTNVDYKKGLDAVLADKSITDVCVLGNFGSMQDAKMRTIQANDPFYRGWRLQWNGMPVNAAVGSENVKDSIVYTATRSLQIYGDSPGRGTQILVANRWAKRTIQLENGATKQVTLDGSFIAGAMAALNNSFTVPYETLLRKELPVFDDMDTFNEAETTLVGQASTVYIYKDGAAFRIGESVTVDTSEVALNEISGRVQEQFVSRYVVQEVDSKLVSFVPDGPDDGAAMTQAFIADALLSLRSRQFIAPWTDSAGNARAFDPNEDVMAAADEQDPRIYYYNFWYNLRYPGKRFMGLYSVGRNAFKQQ